VNVPAGGKNVGLRFLDSSGRTMSERVVPVIAASNDLQLNVASVRYINGQVTEAVPGATRVAAVAEMGNQQNEATGRVCRSVGGRCAAGLRDGLRVAGDQPAGSQQ